MKKSWFLLSTLMGLSLSFSASAGAFKTYDLEGFTLHAYESGDVMGNMSYIVEGKEALVTLEEPLFKENVLEFNDYLKKLGKKVTDRIVDYHVGGTADHEVLMVEGMPAFVKGKIYGTMLEGFKQSFGDAMVDLPTGKTVEVPFDSTLNLAGVDFVFEHGASSDFPAASLLIGNQVYLTHFVPAFSHANPLQISSRQAVGAELEEAKEALSSKAVLFIGSHGGVGLRDAVEFKLSYLHTLERLLNLYDNPQDFKNALLEAYPKLKGAEALDALSAALYK